MTRPDIGKFGVWAVHFRFGDATSAKDLAAELEERGYGALWLPGGRGGDLLERTQNLLGATRRVAIATGVLNIWMHEPKEIGTWWRALQPDAQRRILLGLGVGHAPVIGDAWKKPLTKMGLYLDSLSAEGLPGEHLCLAALGPKMLDLAASRTAGAHPYLVTPEHTAAARQRMGPAALLAVEQGVILDSDPVSARARAREHLHTYVKLPNYRASWMRLGFSEYEVLELSDRLVDALFVWGEEKAIACRIKAHFDAGADHVCIQVVSGRVGSEGADELREAWVRLAPDRIGIG